MRTTAWLLAAGLALALSPVAATQQQHNVAPSGWTALFNGKDLMGWKIPEGDNGHWKVVQVDGSGVIDYDASSEAPGNKSLWTERSFRDYEARLDWRIKEVPYISRNMRIVLPDGTDKRDEKGEVIRITAPDSDSGFIQRGHGKAQLNIWNWPVGSGEMYGYRTDQNSSPELRRAATPIANADKNIGEWNTFEVTVRGNTLSLKNNGVVVIPSITLPDLPAEGPLGLQHHGGPKGPDGQYTGIPALVQFRNIFVRELQ
jgi:hypothetical protein